MRLLSIDWDFFQPRIERPQDGDWLLYDWGHHEDLSIMYEHLWYSRAAAFRRLGLPLPSTDGNERDFWSRFRFSEGAKLYVAESHVAASFDEVAEGVTEVYNFDAHHDAGYRPYRELKKLPTVDCGSWAINYVALGARYRVRYPKWRAYAMKGERPAIPIERKVDNGRQMRVPFDRVFVARSGAWCPPWLDGDFYEFLRTCPVKTATLIGGKLVPREWEDKKVREEVEQWNELVAKTGEAQHASERIRP